MVHSSHESIIHIVERNLPKVPQEPTSSSVKDFWAAGSGSETFLGMHHGPFTHLMRTPEIHHRLVRSAHFCSTLEA